MQPLKIMLKNYSLRHSLQNPPWSSTSIGVTTMPQALHLHILWLPVYVLYHILAKYTYHTQRRRVRLKFLLLVIHRIIIYKLLNVHHYLMQNNSPHILTRSITHLGLSSLPSNPENHHKHQKIPAYIPSSCLHSPANACPCTPECFSSFSNNTPVYPYILSYALNLP